MSVLATVQEQLLEIDDLIARVERRVAEHLEPRPSLRASLRGLERQRKVLQDEFIEAAIHAELDVYRYRVLQGSRTATISGLTEAWREFQNLLNVTYAAVLGTPPLKKARGRSQKEIVDSSNRQLELAFGYSFPGSVGLAMTLPNRTGLFPDPNIEKATTDVFSLAEAYGDREKVKAIARRLGPAPVQAMHKWAAAHVAHGYGVGIEWRRGTPEVTQLEIVLQYEELSALATELSRTTLESRIDVTGVLTAVDTDLHQFRIRADDETEFTGAYESAISAEQAATIPARYEAAILKRTRVVAVGGEQEDVTYFLESLTPLA